jgi:hypothetical protein
MEMKIRFSYWSNSTTETGYRVLRVAVKEAPTQEAIDDLMAYAKKVSEEIPNSYAIFSFSPKYEEARYEQPFHMKRNNFHILYRSDGKRYSHYWQWRQERCEEGNALRKEVKAFRRALNKRDRPIEDIEYNDLWTRYYKHLGECPLCGNTF